MHRRGFVSGAAVLAAFAGRRALAAGAPAVAPEDLRSAAREAWLYGLPLIEAARLRTAAIGAAPQAGQPGFNSFSHQRALAGPDFQEFSAPEPDLLYSSAWIHVGAGPAKISVPPTGGRYFSLAVYDLYGNVLETVEGLKAAKDGHDVTVIGPPSRIGLPGYTAPMPRIPALHRVIYTRHRWVWAVARTHVEGDHDLAAAHQLQDRLQVSAKPAETQVRPAPSVARSAPWSDYFFAVQQLIDENPPIRDDEGFFQRIAPAQLGMYGGFETARFADAELPAVAQGVAEAQTLASQAPAEPRVGSWLCPKADLGQYGQDFLYRAQTALVAPGSLKPQAVTPLRALAPGGARAFAGGKAYRLTLPNALPASGLWSLSLYAQLPDGRLFLSPNPIGRGFVGAWTPGLRRAPGGAVEVAIGHQDPGGPANWLPAPASGAFALILRLYAPTEPALARRWSPPPVEPT
ncbi:MAG TPA: DUF1254 domain-containing protein [Caulobacteraceae bacterium]|jgi:hypothetical protein|nr:DUF1254 domain-containing protein [Caulobacteraceae bacterium]